MAVESRLLDRTTIAATIGLIVVYGVVRFAIGLYKARSRMLRIKARGLPMPPYHPIFGHLPFVRKITAKLPKDARGHYLGDLIRRELPDLGSVFHLDMWPFAPQLLLVSSLHGARQVTQETQLPHYHALKGFLEPIDDGQGLVTMEGPTWRKWRTVYNPGFSMSRLLTLTAGIVDETSIFCQKLLSKSESREVFPMKSLTDYLTLDVIGNIILNVRLHSQTRINPLAAGLRSQINWLAFAGRITPLRQFSPIRPLIIWYNKKRMNNFIIPHLDQQLGDIDSKAKSIINLASKAYASDEKTAAQDPMSDSIFKSFALSQVKLFLFSGHDTTSSSVCWLFYVLARHPKIRDQMRAEHDEIFGLNDPGDTIKNDSTILNRLPYTMAVIKESLRLYPISAVTRAGSDGYELGNENGLMFPTKDFMIWVNPQTMHRDPAIWPRADEMIPERWLVPTEDPLHPIKDAWRPFGSGPRNCIAQELAIMEMKIILVMTIRQFDIEPAYEVIEGKDPARASNSVYGERGYQVEGGQPNGHLPCQVRLREQK